MNLNDLRQLFSYTEWANELALKAAEQLSEEQLKREVGISHGSLHGTLVHMAAAEWVWLERWHGRAPTSLQWPEADTATLAALRARWHRLAEERAALLNKLSEADLTRELAFKRLDGSAHSLPLGQQMQHVVNHATLHRGQVVGMIRQLGITPPATDYLFYLRK